MCLCIDDCCKKIHSLNDLWICGVSSARSLWRQYGSCMRCFEDCIKYCVYWWSHVFPIRRNGKKSDIAAGEHNNELTCGDCDSSTQCGEKCWMCDCKCKSWREKVIGWLDLKIQNLWILNRLCRQQLLISDIESRPNSQSMHDECNPFFNTHPYKLLFKIWKRETWQCRVRFIRANKEVNEELSMKDGRKTRWSLFLKTHAREWFLNSWEACLILNKDWNMVEETTFCQCG